MCISLGRFSCFSVFDLYFRLEKLWTTILNPLQEKKKKIQQRTFFRAAILAKNTKLVNDSHKKSFFSMKIVRLNGCANRIFFGYRKKVPMATKPRGGGPNGRATKKRTFVCGFPKWWYRVQSHESFFFIRREIISSSSPISPFRDVRFFTHYEKYEFHHFTDYILFAKFRVRIFLWNPIPKESHCTLKIGYIKNYN